MQFMDQDKRNIEATRVPVVEIPVECLRGFVPNEGNDLVVTTRRVRRWVFPKDQFVEYEQKDEVWCRPLGIGSEHEFTETLTIHSARVSLNIDGVVTVLGTPKIEHTKIEPQ